MVDEKREQELCRAERLEIYKLLIEMADRVSQRRQAANNFYLSVNTVVVGGSATLSTLEASSVSVSVISIAGIAICCLWIMNILSYKTLNEAKFIVINNIEKRLIEQPFEEEWRELDPEQNGKRHKPFHKVEKVVPFVFIFVYVVNVLSITPWRKIYDLTIGSYLPIWV